MVAGLRPFDAHRVGRHDGERRCLTRDEVSRAFAKNDRGYWTSTGSGSRRSKEPPTVFSSHKTSDGDGCEVALTGHGNAELHVVKREGFKRTLNGLSARQRLCRSPAGSFTNALRFIGSGLCSGHAGLQIVNLTLELLNKCLKSIDSILVIRCLALKARNSTLQVIYGVEGAAVRASRDSERDREQQRSSTQQMPPPV